MFHFAKGIKNLLSLQVCSNILSFIILFRFSGDSFLVCIFCILWNKINYYLDYYQKLELQILVCIFMTVMKLCQIFKPLNTRYHKLLYYTVHDNLNVNPNTSNCRYVACTATVVVLKIDLYVTLP